MTKRDAIARRGCAALATLALAVAPVLPAFAQQAPADPPRQERQDTPPSVDPPAPGEIPAPSQPAPGQPGPDETPPEAVIIPEQTEENRIISGSPLTTGKRPEDTATTTEVPVNLGIDGDAPSDDLHALGNGDLPPDAQSPDDTDKDGTATDDPPPGRNTAIEPEGDGAKAE